MQRDWIGYYRTLRMALAYARWRVWRPTPTYRAGARVRVRFHSARYGTSEVLCRIRAITYRFYQLTYDVIVLEDNGWLAFGTKTFVFPENILSHAGGTLGAGVGRGTGPVAVEPDRRGADPHS